MSYSEFREYQVTQIREDIASFADPATDVGIEDAPGGVLITWSMRGTQRQIHVQISPEEGLKVVTETGPLPYTSFLVGADMADLRGAAQMTLQADQVDVFIPTKASYEVDEGETVGPAVEILSKVLSLGDEFGTRVVMVTGEAGAGKTAVLKRFVREKAKQYLAGNSTYLPIYIDAQGRALARLNEALAIELQDLRAALTYHSVATLTRRNALLPIIDGFDELLGVSGYDDAFSSFAAFLDQLDGRGQIIASARSSYYEEEFIERADRRIIDTDQAWNQTPVTVQGWESDERRQYVQEVAAKSGYDKDIIQDLSARLETVFSGSNALLGRKPLFVARTSDLLLTDPDFSPGDDLLARLVIGFIERERKEKLLDRTHSPLLGPDAIEELMEELAEEMWNQETRELDRRSVREVGDYVLSSMDIKSDTAQIVIERMPTFAFLTSSETRGSVGFEHELFFSYFLSKSITEKVGQDQTDLRPVLGRSTLPVEVTERVAGEIVGLESSVGQGNIAVLDRLCNAAEMQWRKSEQVKENAGAIVRQMFKRIAGNGARLTNLTIKALSFAGGDFDKVVIERSSFTGVQFKRSDLRKCQFISCEARDLVFQQPVVQPGFTRLGISGIDFETQMLGVTRYSEEGTEVIFEPRRMLAVLAECGAPVKMEAEEDNVRKVPAEVTDIIERLIRAYRKANPVCETEDQLRGVLASRYWEPVRSELLKHKLVTTEQRSASGPSRVFLRRRFKIDELMAGQRKDSVVPHEIEEFWRDLEKATCQDV